MQNKKSYEELGKCLDIFPVMCSFADDIDEDYIDENTESSETGIENIVITTTVDMH